MKNNKSKLDKITGTIKEGQVKLLVQSNLSWKESFKKSVANSLKPLQN